MRKLTNKSEWVITTNTDTDTNLNPLFDCNRLIDSDLNYGKGDWVGKVEGIISRDNPAYFVVELDSIYLISRVDLYRRLTVNYTNRYDSKEVEIYTSIDGVKWNYIMHSDMDNPNIGAIAKLNFPFSTEAKYVKVSTIRTEVGRSSGYLEIDIYDDPFLAYPNEIVSWEILNNKFSRTGEPLNYCPTVKELESQNLATQNYLENELPKYGDIIKQ